MFACVPWGLFDELGGSLGLRRGWAEWGGGGWNVDEGKKEGGLDGWIDGIVRVGKYGKKLYMELGTGC